MVGLIYVGRHMAKVEQGGEQHPLSMLWTTSLRVSQGHPKTAPQGRPQPMRTGAYHAPPLPSGCTSRAGGAPLCGTPHFPASAAGPVGG